ncbi:MAG: thioredoxin domain-containing protein [Deltaproteobacteria bacterium]|nr:thioredoxin domain-containing protein [Deltaproteobacteria bacterium]
MKLIVSLKIFLLLIFFQFSLQAKSPDPVAKVNGEPISSQELQDNVKSKLSHFDQEIYEEKMNELNHLIAEKLIEQEAKRRKTSVKKLLHSEVDLPAQREFKMNKQEESLDVTQARYKQQFISRLRKEANIEVFLSPPRMNFTKDPKDPSRGKESAELVIVEFTDFQCPFCYRAHETMKRILAKYEDQVHFVQKQFPLGFHQNAKPAALAALCAHEQGAYWKYSELLWENQRQLDKENLLKFAKQTGIDTKKFNSCINKEKYASQVEGDIKEGKKLGVAGTPTFFINGILVGGARPYEYFKTIIDMELSKQNN